MHETYHVTIAGNHTVGPLDCSSLQCHTTTLDLHKASLSMQSDPLRYAIKGYGILIPAGTDHRTWLQLLLWVMQVGM